MSVNKRIASRAIHAKRTRGDGMESDERHGTDWQGEVRNESGTWRG